MCVCVGTDATHAEHIAKIQERLYTKMNAERRFEPEKLGLGLCEGYDQMGHALSKPHLRAELESQLKAYARRKRSHSESFDAFLFVSVSVKVEQIQRVTSLVFFTAGC